MIYTDVSAFCTVFRSTYRRINTETTEDEVQQGHEQIYNYARCLYEAIEFFGQRMPKQMKVHHGLDKILYFGEFTAYFNQPVSTTPTLTVAKQFSKETGIILTLKSGAPSDDIDRVPKYLTVSWLSAFREEEEKLFYGDYVQFKIVSIMDAATGTEYTAELTIFNKFQKLIQSGKTQWKDAEIKRICEFITRQLSTDQSAQPPPPQSDTSSKAADYGEKLFDYFCKERVQ